MSMLVWLIVIAYCLGFVLAGWINATMLPVTPGLALLRSALWPIWLASGFRWPGGRLEPMD